MPSSSAAIAGQNQSQENSGADRLLNQLDDVRQYRNELAHATLDVSNEQLTKPKLDGIGLVFYEEGERKIRFVPVAEVDERQNQIHDFIQMIKELQILQTLPYPGKSVDDSI